jgi:pimeloyl-ACP methyl ester carboxylesterase
VAAVEELREATGETRVVLAGLRLGASVAALAARRAGGVDALVLWEPVVDGAAHLADLRAAHAAWMRDHAPGAALGPDEVLGFPLPAALAADICGLRLDEVASPSARRVLVIGSESGGPAPWKGVAAAEQRTVPPAPVWLHAEGMSHALVPGPILDGMVGWLRGGAG